MARGLLLRHDRGPQYRSAHFLGSIAWLGIADDAAFLCEPEAGGCAARWIRTLKAHCLWAELHDSVDQLRKAVTRFVEIHNTRWLIGRLGHRIPKQAYQAAHTTAAARSDRSGSCPTIRALFRQLLPAGADAPIEGDVEGVQGGLPAVAPAPAAAPCTTATSWNMRTVT